MKKLKSIFAFLFVFSTISFAQIAVKDTLLLAFGNETFWGSSSELEMSDYADYGKYGSLNLADNDPTTCWAEGSKNDGIGEYIWFTIAKGTQKLRIRNGYQKSESIFFSNNRIKAIDFELFACYEPAGIVTENHNGFFISSPIAKTKAILKDSFGYQEIDLNLNWDEISTRLLNNDVFDDDRFILKFKIMSIYKGDKWNDACISDINIIPAPYYDKTFDDHGFLRISDNNTDTLFYNPEYIYQIVEVSPDLNWVIFIRMPSDIEFSRVETEYKLYNTSKEEFIDAGELVEMYGFEVISGKLYLQGSNKDLEDVSKQLE